VRPDPTPPPIITPRTDLLAGYYGGREDTAALVNDHVNLYWAAGWGLLPGTITELRNAASIPNIVLAVPAYSGELAVRTYLDGLKSAGVLAKIKGLYPIDEPDIVQNGPKSDVEVTATNMMLRTVMQTYPELKDAGLWVIYSCATGRTPGFLSYDVVGCDDYGQGCNAGLNVPLHPNQKRLRVTGGADPWREDPTCSINKAHNDPQTAAVIFFTCIDYGPKGICSNGMLPTYRAAGQKLIRKDTP